MVYIGAIVLKAANTTRAADFWRQAVTYEPGSNPDFLLPIETGRPRLHLDETDETHLDLWVAEDEQQDAEIARLEALGAVRVPWTYPEDADFVVLADPDGNRFCVINRGQAGARADGT